MEYSAKIVDCIEPLTIFEKDFKRFWQGYEYASDKSKQKPGALSLILKKLGLQSLQFLSTFEFNITFTLHCGETLLITNSLHVSLISNWLTHAVEYI